MILSIKSDEKGYALVLAIMLLGILMVSGVFISNSTVQDYDIVKNTVVYSQNFAAAESAAMTAVQALENQTNRTALDPTSSTLESGSEPDWLNVAGEVPDYPNASNQDENSSSFAGKWKEVTLPIISNRMAKENAKLKYRFIGWQPARGASLGAYNENILQEGRIRGVYYSSVYGATSIELGYKKRF